MNYLLTLFTALGILAIAAALPQLLKILKVKNTDEFSLLSFLIWGSYQAVATAYTISIHAHLYTVLNTCWTIFYIVMICLIIKYGKGRK